MTIQPTTTLGSIVVEELPDIKGVKTERLPGGSDDPRNLLSPSQVKIVATFAKDNLDKAMTWEQACTFLRRQAGISGAQWDFPIVEYAIHQSRKATAGLDLTEGQQKLVDTCTQALSGVKAHFDAKIQARIEAQSSMIRDQVLVRFMTAQTRGQLTVAMNLFTNLFGKPEHGSGELDFTALDAPPADDETY